MESGGGGNDDGAAAKQQQLVESFCGITSASREEAVFFLESHNWQLESAIQSFYDEDNNQIQQHRPPPPSQHQRQSHSSSPPQEEQEDDDVDYVPPADLNLPPGRPSGRDKKKSKKPSGRSRPSGGIRTLADLNHQPSGSDTDDSDEPQEYYTGGEKSGMLVQDPSRGNHDVDSIFEQAKKMGATQGPFENVQPSSSSRSFTGTARLLSGESVPAASQPQQPENVVHNIVFWSNGFTVNDGPLRRFDNPDNAPFLESIRKSECPIELAPSDRKSAVHVNLIRREEKCPEPTKRKSSFQGVGRTLGSGSSATVEPTATVVASSNESPLSVGLSVDDSLPSTSIQLRLADGTRMVARFNNHHTVGDIRSFIDASRPGATRSYLLQTVGFPPKQLNDVTQTIVQAGLANSVVIQRL